MSKIKIGAIMVLCLTLCLGVLTGCGKKPKDAAELLQFSSEAMKDVSAFHVDGKVDVNVAVTPSDEAIQKEMAEASGGETSMEIPISMSGSADVTKEAMSGNVKYDISMMGDGESNEVQFYTDLKSDPKMMYTKDSESEDWTKKAVESGDVSAEDIDAEAINKEMNKFVKYLKLSEEDDNYVLTLNLTDIPKEELVDLFKSVSDSSKTEEGESVIDDETMTALKSMLGDTKLTSGKMVIKYDKSKFYVTSMEISDVVIDANVDLTSLGMGKVGIKVDANVNMAFSKFNEVKVTIPEDVIANAKASDSGDDITVDDWDGDTGLDEDFNVDDYGDDTSDGSTDGSDIDISGFEPGPGVTVTDGDE